jgi:DNA-binding GntR family transcriptional regulator
MSRNNKEPPPTGSRTDADDTSRAGRDPTKASSAYRLLRDELWHLRIRNQRDLTVQPLADRLGVSRTTITRVLDRLTEEQWLRRMPMGRHAPVVPPVEAVRAAYAANLALADLAYGSAQQFGKRRYRREPERLLRLAQAAILETTRDPDLAATELEILLRKLARHTNGAAAEAAVERELALLARIRRVEHHEVPQHFAEVAQLMRYFYQGRYPNVLRSLRAYTRRRISLIPKLVTALRASEAE